MEVKNDNKDKFISVMMDLVKAIKNEADNCGKLCGGANEKEVFVIVYIGQNQSVKMSDIADNIEAPMSTLTSIVDKLVEKGILSRDHSGEDRRVVNVFLTSHGKAVYKALVMKREFMAEKLLSKYNENDQDTFIEHIRILASTLSS